MTTAETNATDKAAAMKAASQKKGAPKAKKTAKGGKATPVPMKAAKTGSKTSKKAAAPRAESKGAKILDMIARAKGATLAEIQKATDWQVTACVGSSRPPRRSENVRSHLPCSTCITACWINGIAPNKDQSACCLERHTAIDM